MKMKTRGLMLLCLIGGTLSLPRKTRDTECDLATEFMCKDESCVPIEERCDGKADCYDGSDECGCGEQCSDGMFSCDNGDKCIDPNWVCDTERDCDDETDEIECPATTPPAPSPSSRPVECTEDQFRCSNGEKCIYGSWKCDNYPDCQDGSDEKDCPTQGPTSFPSPSPSSGPVQCTENEFRCANGEKCIYDHWECDNDLDCQDGSDELECPPTPGSTPVGPTAGPEQCNDGEFRCANGEKCIYGLWKCDDYPDCQDGSDEKDCPTPGPTTPGPTSGPVECNDDEFRCANGERCIYSQWKCDKYDDCGDNSDEMDCPTQGPTQCTENQFKCPNEDNCIYDSWKCDGYEDCLDGSDELNCPTTTLPPPKPCDSDDNKCDGFNDCEDGSDENPEMCQTFTCPDGYSKCGDGKTCISDSAKCDGYQDCLDGSDEQQCKDHMCTDDEFKCPDSFCLKTSNGNGRCNGVPECPNGEDEQNCGGLVAKSVQRSKQLKKLEELLAEMKRGNKRTVQKQRSDAYKKVAAMRAENVRRLITMQRQERGRALHSQSVGSARGYINRHTSNLNGIERRHRIVNSPIRRKVQNYRRSYSPVSRTERLRQKSDYRTRNMNRQRHLG